MVPRYGWFGVVAGAILMISSIGWMAILVAYALSQDGFFEALGLVLDETGTRVQFAVLFCLALVWGFMGTVIAVIVAKFDSLLECRNCGMTYSATERQSIILGA